MFVRALLLVSLCVVLGPSVRAQDQSRAELEAALETTRDGRERYAILYALTESYLASSTNSDREVAADYGQSTYRAAQAVRDPDFLAASAYLTAQAYQKLRNLGKAESWLKVAYNQAKKNKNASLLLKTTSERTRIASRRKRYREAVKINEETLDFFTQDGNDIETLRARLVRQRAELVREQERLTTQTRELRGQIEALSEEKTDLEGANVQLAQRNRRTSQALEKQAEVLEERSEELERTTAQKEAVQQRVAEKQREIQTLSREALEQQAIAAAAREELARQELLRVETELELAEQHEQRNLIVGAGLVFLLLAFTYYLRFRTKERLAGQLALERQKSDDLLENILPVTIARELKEHGVARARNFPEATVLFCDFVNFTATAERLGAEALVRELDRCFRAFDEIVDRYEGVEKIKTIGDAYLVASGLSERRTVPNDIVAVALEMQAFLEGGSRIFRARIGLHTGPVVAGVVGARKFAYDIWGDTVNVASRVEGKSEPGRVTVSDATYQLIKYRYGCTPRGPIPIKNRGTLEMYFVDGPLAGLSS